MSSFIEETKNPETGKWEQAEWLDDYFGSHLYGVRFADGHVYDPTKQPLLTRTAEQSKMYQKGDLVIMIANEDGKWHLSISHPSRLPTYEELKDARYELLPDNIYMAQIFPPKAEFVNAHPFCLHLWQI